MPDTVYIVDVFDSAGQRFDQFMCVSDRPFDEAEFLADYRRHNRPALADLAVRARQADA